MTLALSAGNGGETPSNFSPVGFDAQPKKMNRKAITKDVFRYFCGVIITTSPSGISRAKIIIQIYRFECIKLYILSTSMTQYY